MPAAPLILPAALVSAASFGGPFPGSRKLLVAALLMLALFSAVWSKAESVLGDTIYHAVRYIEQVRSAGDLTYTGSSTAMQLLTVEGLTFQRRQDAHRGDSPCRGGRGSNRGSGRFPGGDGAAGAFRSI